MESDSLDQNPRPLFSSLTQFDLIQICIQPAAEVLVKCVEEDLEPSLEDRAHIREDLIAVAGTFTNAVL